jgi:hypothetical protein
MSIVHMLVTHELNTPHIAHQPALTKSDANSLPELEESGYKGWTFRHTDNLHLRLRRT